jgi:hypothetical protein
MLPDDIGIASGHDVRQFFSGLLGLGRRKTVAHTSRVYAGNWEGVMP